MNGRPERKDGRIPDHPYDSGAWFVTVCTQNRAPLFGRVVGAGSKPARVELTEYGEIVWQTWYDLPNHIAGISLDAFVVMPDHVHGIITIDGRRAGLEPAPTPLPEIVRQFKTFSARRINALRGTQGTPVWQRSYYEHAIRNDSDFRECAEYIKNNPIAWAERRGP